MDDFEKRKLEVLTPLLVEAGAGLLDSQTFEYGIALFLYYLSGTGLANIDHEKMTDIMDDIEKRTSGQLIKLLKEHVTMSEEKENLLKDALSSRNKLIHRMLVDNIERAVDSNSRNILIKEIRGMRSKIQKGIKVLQPINLELGKLILGVDFESEKEELLKQFLRGD